ncbi:MAG: DUF4139 domain-containing protein [Deltaproteobacteria bacterium]|nr:DUF4139 domain-containing protein [Deltaproteobacteria bacterium]
MPWLFLRAQRWLVPVLAGAGLAVILSGCRIFDPPAAPAKAMADLPIKKVVLYQNGVGYFERRGKTNLESVELRVRPDQVNDVLKSLAVLDLSGGAASSISLPAEKSADRQQADLPAQVRNATGMIGMLAVLRGADVTVETNSDTWSGRVVGVENPPQSKDEKTRPATVTLLVGDDRLVPVHIDAIKKVTIGDRALSVGLKQSLDISKREGAWKPVSLQVRVAGDKTHDLLISYIHEVPVWRPAYRAWVESGKGLQLQGWAVVDNTSGEDWNKVNLSLVVGAPLSFRYDLHTAHHVVRPDLSVRLPQEAVAPPEPDSGFDAAPADAPAAPAAEAAAMPPPAPSLAPEAKVAEEDLKKRDVRKEAMLDASGAGPGGGGMGEGRFGKDEASPRMRRGAKAVAAVAAVNEQEDERQKRDQAIKNVQALVTGKEVGALYAYEASYPVTVPDRSSALINILNRHLEGRDVYLFREPGSGQPPYRAVMLKNDATGPGAGALEGGPITLYIDGTFAGEGFVGHIAKGEVAFVPYARESGSTVSQSSDDKTDELRLVTVVDGRIRIEGKQLHIRTFTVESNAGKPGLAYVKTSATANMTLRDPPKDFIKAGSDWYVPVPMPAKGKGETVIVEESPVSFEELDVTERAADAMILYLKGAKVEDAVRGPIQQLLAIRAQIGDIQRDTKGLDSQRAVLDDEQRRIQGNLDSLPTGAVAADLRRQLVGQLESASKKAAEVAKKLVENEVKIAALREKSVVLLRSIALK